MFDWLIEDPTTAYLILGVVALGLIALLWITRKKHWLIGVGVVVALAVVVFLLSTFLTTDGKQIKDAILGMRAGVQKHDAAAVMKHVAKDFQFQSVDRARFQSHVDNAFKGRLVDDVNVWEFDELKVDRPNKTANITFKAKPSPQHSSAEGLEHYLIRATFVLETDNQWRMKTFQVFNPFVETDKPVQVPLP
jgi:hypothetical protein